MTFSVAVAFMAGWLVLALLLRESDPPTAMADREVPAMATKQPPRVAAQAAISRALVAASHLLSPKADPVEPTGLRARRSAAQYGAYDACRVLRARRGSRVCDAARIAAACAGGVAS